MPRPSWRNLPLLLYVAGTGLVIATVVLGILLLPDGGGHHAQTSLPVSTRPSQPPTPTTTPTTATLPTTEPTTTAPVAPPRIAMSWQTAGGLVYDAQAVDPTVLGNEMRAAGFGWVAVRIADGTTVIAPSPQWISLFRAASGLPVGGWSVLRDRPVQEAQLASSLIAQDGLDFYIANAEQEYAYTIGTDSSPDRFARSRAFVTAFRAAEPTLRAGLSSYCRPDGQDIDWGTWAKAGFAFLPQAYVGDLGPSGEPATCVLLSSLHAGRVLLVEPLASLAMSVTHLLNGVPGVPATCFLLKL